MSNRTVHLCSPGSGQTMAVCGPESREPTHIAISGVPDSTPTDEVIRVVAGLVIHPWPTRPVAWDRVRDLPQGSLVRDLI